jgi:AsmA protein
MKKLLIIIAAIVLLLVIVAVAIPLFFDANSFKPMVQTQAKKALGRDVTLGDISLSIFSGAVVVKDVSISEDPAFGKEPFVKAKALKVGVELMPLITSRQVNVQSISLEEPEIRLIQTPAGKWNFASLGTAKEKGGSSQPIAVKDLKITDGELSIVKSGKQSQYHKLNVELQDFTPTSASPFTVSAETPGGGELKVEGKAGPLSQTDMTESPVTADVHVKNLDLASTGVIDPASGISGKIDYDGTIKSDGDKMHSEGKLTADKLKVVKAGAPATVPVTVDYATDMDVKAHHGTLTKGDILIKNSKAHLTGTIDTKGETPSINARLKGDGLPINDVAGLLPAFGVILPQGSQLQGGTVNTDLQLQGPLDKLVTTGPIKVENAKLAGFNLKSHASSISALAGMSSASDMMIQLLNSNLRVAPEGIKADGINLVVPALGTVTGDGTIGANNNLNFKMKAKLLGGGGLLGGVSALSTLGQSKGELPFLIQGTTSNPIFLPDMASAITNSVKAPVKDVQGVGGIFGGLFGKKKKTK